MPFWLLKVYTLNFYMACFTLGGQGKVTGTPLMFFLPGMLSFIPNKGSSQGYTFSKFFFPGCVTLRECRQDKERENRPYTGKLKRKDRQDQSKGESKYSDRTKQRVKQENTMDQKKT